MLRLLSASTVLSSAVGSESSTAATPWAKVTVVGRAPDRKSSLCVISRLTVIGVFAVSPATA